MKAKHIVKENKFLTANIIIGLVLTVIGALVSYKVLRTGFTADEEYQLVLIYRLVKGDLPLREVWDTLQTSAFYGEFFMWLFVKITGSTEGSLLFLRSVGIVTQGVVCFVLYRTLKKHINPSAAVLVSFSLFCTYTKLIAIPDFSNLQVWSLVLMTCLLWNAYDHFREEKARIGNLLVAISALFFCVAVLSSACIILVPVMIVFLLMLSDEGKLQRIFIFFGVCAVCAGLFIMAVFYANGFEDTVFGIEGIISGDGTHNFSHLINGDSKIIIYSKNIIKLLILLAATAVFPVIVFFALRRKEALKHLPAIIWIVESFAYTCFNWFIGKTGYEGLKLFIPVMMIVGAIYYFKKSKKDKESEMLPAFFGSLIGFFVFVNVLFISNMSLILNLTFLNISALFSLVIIIYALERSGACKTAKILPGAFLLITALGTGLTLNLSPIGATVFDLSKEGEMKEGPSRGTIVSKEMAEIYDDNYRYFEELTKEPRNVFIVTNYEKNESLTTLYMVNDSNVCHYTVNSTPTYGDRVLDYWDRYSRKKPDCVILQTDSARYDDMVWIYDSLLAGNDDFIMSENGKIQYFILQKES